VRPPLRWALAVAAGCALALPFWLDALEPFLVLGVLLWALAVDPRLNPRGVLAGTASIALFVFAGTAWLGGLSILGSVALALYVAAYVVLLVLAYRFLVRRGAPAWIALPLFWVTGEHLVLAAGIFPTSWLAIGYSCWRIHPLVQSADLWGTAGLAFLLTLWAGLGAEGVVLWGRGRARALAGARFLAGAAAAVLLLAGALGYGAWRERTLPLESGPTVVLVQGNVPQKVKNDEANEWAILEKHVRLTREAAGPGVSAVFWPETTASVFPDHPRDAAWVEAVTALATETGVPLVVGANGLLRSREELRATNSAYLFLPEQGPAARYDKLVLVPMGEYVPLVGLLPEDAQEAIRDRVRDTVGLYPYMLPGEEPVLFDLPHGDRLLRVGPLICYEDVLPGLTADFVRRGADLLANLSNEAWYWEREMDQHLAIAALRCIETRRPMVRATNTGLTAVLGPTGRVVARLERDREGTLRAEVPLSGARSPFVRFGPWFAEGCAAAFALLLAAAWARGQRSG
jgi:apolipoprotein N-acyltransferase